MEALMIHDIHKNYFDLDLSPYRLTFDDGLFSQYYYYPLLKSHPGDLTYFITTSFIKPGTARDMYAGEYVATVTDAHECVTSDTVVVGYTYESCLVIPNAFSPNGDGFNDYWMIEGLELYPNAEIRIYDRWGTRVYYSPNAMDDPWDGTFDGRVLPIDSYHYIIDLQTDDPGIKGNVTIVR